MQRWFNKEYLRRKKHLQYPQTDRPLCNTDGSGYKVATYDACSILKRIDPYATVASILRFDHRERSCSILKRIDPYATQKLPYMQIKVKYLAVSSNGSTPMQHLDFTAGNTGKCVLQYPQTDRPLCNEDAVAVERLIQYLLQYPQTDRPLCNRQAEWYRQSAMPSCSILKRIDPYATLGSCKWMCQPHTCSILKRIDPYATWPQRVWSMAVRLILQYPQTDRPLCNPIVHHLQDRHLHLQYPQTDRPLCNMTELTRTRLRIRNLAVSSNGSTPMQPRQGKRESYSRYQTCSILKRIDPYATRQ